MKTLFAEGAAATVTAATIAVLLASFPGAFGQTNPSKYGYVTNADLLTPFTLTNRVGRVITNAVLYKLAPNEITYKAPDGGMGTARFDSLPENLREKFGYNPADAAQADKVAEQRELNYQQRVRQEQILAKEKARHDGARAKAQASETLVTGRVIQNTKAGLLFSWQIGLDPDRSSRYVTILLTDFGGAWAADDIFSATVYPVGNYSYETVKGAENTVHVYTYSLDKAIEYWLKQ